MIKQLTNKKNNIRILIFIFIFLLFHSSAFAVDVVLEWDASTQPNLDHYIVYWGTSPVTETDYTYNSENIDKSLTSYTVTDLKGGPVYYFAVKVFDDQGKGSEYSNEVSTATVQKNISYFYDNANDDTTCFIATAAFGSKLEKHVRILCLFRDRFLLTNHVGAKFVEFYYKHSPPIADSLREHPVARALVRYALLPITGIAYVILNMDTFMLPVYCFIMLISLACLFIWFKKGRVRDIL